LLKLIVILVYFKRKFKWGNIQNTSVTVRKRLDSLIYEIHFALDRNYAGVIKWSGFWLTFKPILHLSPPCRCFTECIQLSFARWQHTR